MIKRLALQGLAATLVAGGLAGCTIPDVPVQAGHNGDDATTANAVPDGASATEAGDADNAEDGTTAPGSSDTGANEAGLDAALSEANAEAGSGAVGVLGATCPSVGLLACNGNAQKIALICGPGGVWIVGQTCPADQNCDSTPGANQGTCAAIDPTCVGASSGQDVCGATLTVVQCGPDLLADTPVETCVNEPCVSGTCPKVCTPGDKKCMGDAVESCGADGEWADAVTCLLGPDQFCTDGACSAGPPSCPAVDAGVATCAGQSCCASVNVVTGGAPYSRTYTNTGTTATGLADSALISEFRLDVFPVTVGRFRQFVTAWDGGAGFTPQVWSGKHTYLNGGQGLVNGGADAGATYEPGWVPSDDSNIAPTSTNLGCSGSTSATWTATPGSNENLPINCVNWYEAYAFCIWDGGFLPSEAEWEFAAGGGRQLEYPWGSTAPGTANRYAIFGDGLGNCYYPSTGTCTNVTNIAPVGTATLGAGPWGHLDMEGEVYEWNLDWYAASYLNPCVDCANLTPSSNRVFRGSTFRSSSSQLLPPNRNSSPPTSRSVYTGMRCARHLETMTVSPVQ